MRVDPVIQNDDQAGNASDADERITGFATRFPGAKVSVTTRVDEHNGLARCGWRAADGRLQRVVMFFGAL